MEFQRKYQIGRIIGNIIFGLAAMLMGAAIVHGMIIQNCPTGVISQVCKEKDTGVFEAGVLPPTSQSKTVEVKQENVPVLQAQKESLPAFQQSVQAPQPHQQSLTASTAQKLPAKTKSVQPTTQQKSMIKVQAKPVSYDLNKLSIAVAMQETHNCNDHVGAALYNNCHGLKLNNQFLHFKSQQASHDYFKQLWSTKYVAFPNENLARIYSGNDKPTQWLRNVTYYYNKL